VISTGSRSGRGPAGLSQGVEQFIQERAVNDYWAKVDPDLGVRITHEVGLTVPTR
jgi:catalase